MATSGHTDHGRFSDWLALHDVDHGPVQRIVSACRSGVLIGSPAWLDDPFQEPVSVAPGIATRQTCLHELVIPAFETAFAGRDALVGLSALMEFRSLSHHGVALPHTVDRRADSPVLVALDWAGTPSDVICLAHEVAHALQILLSGHVHMPPVAREVCAFLGELIVIAHAHEAAPELFSALCGVWHRENEAYLGADAEALLAALADPRALYHYRQNYPIARLAAVDLFERGGGDRMRALFAAGSDGMRHLPIEAMAERAGGMANPLPPLPEPAAEGSAIDAYRSLGAMTLIDIDYRVGTPSKRIEDYYRELLRHLQDKTALVALDERRRPVGYATWSGSARGTGITPSRLAAPFGDHLALRRAVQRHTGRTVW